MPRHGALYRPARTHHQRRDPQALHPPESRRHVRRWSRHRQPPPSAATSAATAKQEISPPEPPQVAPAPSMSTRPGLSRASSATTSPTTSAATCCSTKLASASAEPPGAAGYRDWDRREKKTIYASEQGPEARWRYLAWIQQIDPHRSVFVDESGFNLAMTLPYAYAPGDNVPWVGCRRAVGRRPAWLQPSVSMRV